MQKIKDNLIKNIYRYNLSRLSLVVLLDMINCSDEKGKVEVYYKDLAALADCSEAQFYNVLNELENLDLITRMKNYDYKREMIIKIKDNDFSKSGYNSYVDTNMKFFTDRMYANLKAGTIRTYLYLIFRVKKQKFDGTNNRNKLFYNNSYKSIASQIGVGTRMVKKYCEELSEKKIINIGVKEDAKKHNYDLITLGKESAKKPEIEVCEKGQIKKINPSDLHQHWCHTIKNLCRRYGKNCSVNNLNNAAVLFGQYKNKAEEKGRNIYRIITNAIKNLLSLTLDSKALHSIIRSKINLDYDNAIIAY